MKLLCRFFGHRMVGTAGVFCNPDPHPLYITGTFRHTVEKKCSHCGYTWRSKDYDYWAERGFEDRESYRFHDHPEDVEEFARTHNGRTYR